jgi:spore germination cell wall hydrolase CwlJ-like protein
MEKLLRIGLLSAVLICVGLLVQSITHNKFQTLREKSLTGSSADVVTIQTRERQLACLAINIYKEAGYEPFEGKVAVAQVVMNRVKSGKFANDVCGVVYQKNVIMEKVVCQFSWYCDSVHKNRAVNKDAYQESYDVAKKVLLEGFKLDILRDALYYHATYVNPRWKHEKIGKIGQHIFYKERNNEIASAL